MNLRKEIEKLPGLDGSRVCPSAWVYRIDVLALLDRYELVAEHSIGRRRGVFRHIIVLDRDAQGTDEILVKSFVLNPGDRIAIYRRCKNEK